MKKNKIIEKLTEDNTTKGRNSMGVSESFYNKYYLTKRFLKEKSINQNDLTERELNLLLDLAEFAGDAFY